MCSPEGTSHLGKSLTCSQTCSINPPAMLTREGGQSSGNVPVGFLTDRKTVAFFLDFQTSVVTVCTKDTVSIILLRQLCPLEASVREGGRKRGGTAGQFLSFLFVSVLCDPPIALPETLTDELTPARCRGLGHSTLPLCIPMNVTNLT